MGPVLGIEVCTTLKHTVDGGEMVVKVCCAREQEMSCKVGAAAMRTLIVNSTVLFMILFFAALSFVCEGSVHQSNAMDTAMASMKSPEAKLSRFTLYNQVYTIRFRSRIRSARAIQTGDGGKNITKVSLVFRKVMPGGILARQLQAASDGDCNAVAVATSFRWPVHRRIGPLNDPTRKRMPLALRPVKLFVLCANRALKVKKIGTAASSPHDASPANQHVIPFGNNHRRALKEIILIEDQTPPAASSHPPPLAPCPPASPLPNPKSPPKVKPASSLPSPPSLPSFLPFPPPSGANLPPLPFFTPPPSPELPLPALPFTFPPVPTLPFTLPTPPLFPIPLPPPLRDMLCAPPAAQILPKPLPLINIPPLPFQIPPLPTVPSSSLVKSVASP